MMRLFENLCWHILIALSIISASAGATCPPIISRREWNARPALTRALEVHPATHVVVHHSSTATCTSQTNCMALVRSIQKIHMNYHRFRDIGYNFLIGEDGNIYEGVGWNTEGTHEGRVNAKSLGVCFLGDYTSWLPNEAAVKALERLITCGVEEGYLSLDYKLITHSQLKNTDCPGQKLYYHMRGWDHWVAGP